MSKAKNNAGQKSNATASAFSPKAFPVAGIGASAGGIEAILELLEYLPENLGIAYIIIQHLSPHHTSLLPEVLQARTRMKVHHVQDGTPVLPDNLYVIPPGTYMSITGGQLRLSEPLKTDAGTHSIDFFFNALARAYKNNAIGIILSGTANDGTGGVASIKAEGGITLAQDDSALFGEMPRNAQNSGLVDLILSPAQIAQELSSLSQLEYPAIPSTEEILLNEVDLRRVYQLLLDKKGVDFSHYKKTTINRRIMRRMALNKFNRLKDYIQFLNQKEGEVTLLYNDLLINVTSFFRDATVVQSLLKKIFPILFKDRRTNDPVRIWIPACSTGEEAYSFAICLFEYLGELAITTPLQIFATDLSEIAIEKARSGIYAKNMLENVSSQRLRKFFVKTDGKYQIIKPIRDICVFATHNLLKDPPFSRMDLISCQNVLIYLETTPQKKILQAFHYALKPSGFLVLGKSETTGNASDLFVQVEKEFKIYSKIVTPGNLSFDFSVRSNLRNLPNGSETRQPEKPASVGIDIEKETDKILLSRYVPASLLVDKDLQILRFNGPTSNYLQPASGKASLHLLKIVREELVHELRTLIHRCKKEGQSVKREGLHLPVNGNLQETSIEAVPVQNCILIVFKELAFSTETGSSRKIKRPDTKERHIQIMENELRESREHMKTMSEEFEGIREELQSANEEILSSNEELQSINEELETSKEELQSTNEELTTINEELQLRNNDLKESVDYAEAIIQTIREPLIILDVQRRVRTANKAFYDSFRSIQDETEGHHFFEMSNGQWNIPELREQLNDIITNNKNFQDFEVKSSFSIIGDKVLLFSAMRMANEDPKKNKYLVVIEDITLRRQAENELKKSYQVNTTILNSISDVFISVNNNWTFTYVNNQAEEFVGKKASELLGKNMWDILPMYIGTDLHTSLLTAMTFKKPAEFEFYADTLSRWYALRIYPSGDGISVYMNNISERKKSHELLAQSKERYESFIVESPEGIWRFELDQPLSVGLLPAKLAEDFYNNSYIAECNDAMAQMYSFKESRRVEGMLVKTIFKKKDIEPYILKLISSDYKLNDVELERIDKQGGKKYFLLNMVGIVEDRLLKRAWITQRDITGTKQLENKLRQNEERFRLLVQNAFDIITIYSKDGTIIYQTEPIERILGYSIRERLGSNIYKDNFVHPEDSHLKDILFKESLNQPGKTVASEFRVRHKNGSFRIMEAVALNLLDNSQINGVVINYRDVTERRVLEKQKEEFIGIASHELKTPVTSIKSYAEILRDIFFEAEDKRSMLLIDKMDKQVDKLTNLIKDLLDVTKINEGQIQLRKDVYDINELIREIAEEVQLTSNNHRIQLELEPCKTLRGDRDRTAQVIVNLLTNAIKYSPGTDKVIISSSSDDRKVTVCVKDYGIGMSKEMQQRVFERFFRITASNINVFPGLGLGLYISAEIVKRQNGEIWVESSDGDGSSFYFSLPYK